MRSAQHKRKALVIISDGGDNRSRYSLKEIRKVVEEADVLTYGIGIFDGCRYPCSRRSKRAGGGSGWTKSPSLAEGEPSRPTTAARFRRSPRSSAANCAISTCWDTAQQRHPRRQMAKDPGTAHANGVSNARALQAGVCSSGGVGERFRDSRTGPALAKGSRRSSHTLSLRCFVPRPSLSGIGFSGGSFLKAKDKLFPTLAYSCLRKRGIAAR